MRARAPDHLSGCHPRRARFTEPLSQIHYPVGLHMRRKRARRAAPHQWGAGTAPLGCAYDLRRDASRGREQIEDREQEDPDDVHEVPIHLSRLHREVALRREISTQ